MLPYSSRLSIVAGCCMLGLLIVASRYPALGFEGESNAPAANDASVRRRILANWRACQEQSKTFHFAWNSQSVPPKKWNGGPGGPHRTLDGRGDAVPSGSFVLR